MEKRIRTFTHLAVTDLVVQSFILIIMSAVFGVLYWKLGAGVIGIADTILILVFMLFGSTDVYSSLRYGEFQMFHFTRKRFYRYQVLLSLLLAAEVGTVRAVYQFLFRESFIEYYIEDTDLVREAFGQIPAWWELLLTNLCLFAIINMIQLLGNTWTFKFFFINYTNAKDGTSLQNRFRKNENKEKNAKLWKWKNYGTDVLGYVFGVVIVCFMGGYYEQQLQHSFWVRMIMLGVLVVIWVGLYFIGKHRYKPEYI